MSAIEAMRADVERALTDIKRRHFVNTIELTFIARLPGNSDADVLISNDDPQEIKALIERRHKETK